MRGGKRQCAAPRAARAQTGRGQTSRTAANLPGCRGPPACRELAEETGIGAAETALTLLSTLVERTALVFTYALRAAPPAGGLRLQPGETSAARWVTRAELTALAESGALSAASARRLAAARAPLDAFLAGRPTAPVYAVLPNENLTPSG